MRTTTTWLGRRWGGAHINNKKLKKDTQCAGTKPVANQAVKFRHSVKPGNQLKLRVMDGYSYSSVQIS